MTIERVGRAMSWSLIARVAAFAAGFAANIMIVRSLGTYDWGILSELKTILPFAIVVVMMGLDAALLRFLPAVRVAGGGGVFARAVRRIVVAQVCVWLALLLASRLGGAFLNSFFHDQSDRFGFYLQVAVGFVIFEIFVQLLSNVFQSWYETKRLAAVIALGNVLYLIVLAAGLAAGLGVIGVIVASGVMNLAMVVALLPHARALLNSAPAAGPGPGGGAVLRFSLPFVATGLLNQIVWRQSEVIFLGHFQGAEVAGFFSLAYRMPQLLLEFVPLTVWPLVMAGTSEAYAKDPKNLPRAIHIYFKLIYLLVVPVAAMGIAFARPLVPILYGAEMLPSALLTQVFFVVFSYSFLYTPMSMALYVMGKSWANMLIFISLAVVEIGLDLALIPRYGLWGAMVPVSLVLILAVVLFHATMRRLRPDVRVPVSFLARCSAAAIPTCLLATVSARWSSPGALALLVPLGVVLLVAGFRLMKVIGEEEKELIMRLPVPGIKRLVSIF